MHGYRVAEYEGGLVQGNAYWMARLSELVYETREGASAPDGDRILSELSAEDHGFEAVVGFDEKQTQAMLVEHKRYLAMVFRGTDELKDWLDNADIREKRYGEGVFHEGFYNATMRVWAGIRGALEDARARQKARGEPKRPVFVTGHSLGGAMATVAAAKLLHEDLPFTAAFTFGQPRAVDAETGRQMNAEARDRYWRFCNDMDVVTRVPTRLRGFRHVGNVVYIDHDGCIEAKLSRWQQFLNRVDNVRENLEEDGLLGAAQSLKELIRDHDISRYRRAIETCTRWP